MVENGQCILEKEEKIFLKLVVCFVWQKNHTHPSFNLLFSTLFFPSFFQWPEGKMRRKWNSPKGEGGENWKKTLPLLSWGPMSENTRVATYVCTQISYCIFTFHQERHPWILFLGFLAEAMIKSPLKSMESLPWTSVGFAAAWICSMFRLKINISTTHPITWDVGIDFQALCSI